MTDSIVGSEIDTSLIEEILERLGTDQKVRRSLKPWGRINIDRQLPFLCVYRRSNSYREGDEKLVQGEASYCTVSGEADFHEDLSKFVLSFAREMSSRFGAFLLIEVWIKPFKNTDDMPAAPPAIRVLQHDFSCPQVDTSGFVKSLRSIRIQKQPALVKVESASPHAPDSQAILNPPALLKNNIFAVGLEVTDVYRDSVTEQFFPRVRQRILRGVSSSIQKLVFDFTNQHTNYRPSNYQSLGKKSLVKAAWNIDKQLAQINESFDLVLSVTPTNTQSAFAEFKRNNCDREPRFYYRPLSIDPGALKRQLYSLNIDSVEDPAMSQLFYQQQRSLDSRITLLADRDTERFKYESIQLYGKPNSMEVDISRHLLSQMSSVGKGKKKNLGDSNELAQAAKEELDYYKTIDSNFTAQFEIRDDITGVLVSDGNLLIGKNVVVAKNRLDSVLQHEIGTHLLTYYNGQHQPFRQLKAGFVGYDELQEGLAVLSEYLSGGLTKSRLKTLAARVVAVHSMVEGASFVEAFRELVNRFGFRKEGAFKLLMRVYRGGGFTKDAVYLRGLMWLLDYFRSSGDLETLLVGKFPIEHIGIIKELMWRGVVRKPILMPRYIHRDEAKHAIDRLHSGLEISQLANELDN